MWIPKDADIDAMQALQSSNSVTEAGFENGKRAAQVNVAMFLSVYENCHARQNYIKRFLKQLQTKLYIEWVLI